MKKMRNYILTYLRLIYNIINTKRKKRIIKAFFKSRKEILEGINNSIIKNKDVVNIAKYRMSICDECDMITYNNDECVVEGLAPCCLECGCGLLFKTYSLSAACPLHKWDRVISEEQELEYLIKTQDIL